MMKKTDTRGTLSQMMNRESCCQEEKDKDTRGTLSQMMNRESCCQEEKDKEELCHG